MIWDAFCIVLLCSLPYGGYYEVSSFSLGIPPGRLWRCGTWSKDFVWGFWRSLSWMGLRKWGASGGVLGLAFNIYVHTVPFVLSVPTCSCLFFLFTVDHMSITPQSHRITYSQDANADKTIFESFYVYIHTEVPKLARKMN